jgi:N-methylhydantoinase B/oxoprolinase/acetone carboxylase alpha subunit
MSNTRNTPVEAIEHYLPVRVQQYGLRKGSGGNGQFPGGDGIIREYEMLTETTVTVLSERRVRPPYGARGGEPGSRGRNTLIRGGKETPLPGKVEIRLAKGDHLRIESPGGGGWGRRSGKS